MQSPPSAPKSTSRYSAGRPGHTSHGSTGRDFSAPHTEAGTSAHMGDASDGADAGISYENDDAVGTDGHGTAQSRKRIRSSLACNNCNRKKIKCLPTTGNTCVNCKRYNIVCLFDRHNRRKTITAEVVEHLEERLSIVEKAMLDKEFRESEHRVQDHADVARGDTVSCSSQLQSQSQTFQAHIGLQQASPSKFISSPHGSLATMVDAYAAPLSSNGSVATVSATPATAISGTPEPFAVPASSSARLNKSTHVPIMSSPPSMSHPPLIFRMSQSSKMSSLQQIPLDNIIREDLINLFFEFVYPIFNTMQMPDSQAYWRFKAQSSIFLTNAMYCVALRYSSFLDPKYSRHTAGDTFFYQARSLLDSELETPTLSTIFALLLLQTYSYFSGRRTLGRTFYSIREKMCVELRVHREPDLSQFSTNGVGSAYEQEIRRRLWWTSWSIDNYTDIVHNHKMTSDATHCSVSLPTPCRLNATMYRDESVESLGRRIMSSKDMFLPRFEAKTPEGYLLLLEKRVRIIFDHAALFNGERGIQCREEDTYEQKVLDASLSAWRDSLPESLRFSDSDTAIKKTSDVLKQPWIVIYMRLMYYFAHAMIYRSCLVRCLRKTWLAGGGGGTSIGAVVNTAELVASTAPAIEAIRSSQEHSACQSAARSFTATLEALLECNPEFYHFGFFTTFLVYQVGWIHVATARVFSSPTFLSAISVASAAAAKAAAERARSQLNVHMTALRQLGRYWSAPTIQYSLLRFFRETQEYNMMMLPFSELRKIPPTELTPLSELDGFLVDRTASSVSELAVDDATTLAVLSAAGATTDAGHRAGSGVSQTFYH